MQVEAVGAIEIALRPARLDHRVKPIEIAASQFRKLEFWLLTHLAADFSAAFTSLTDSVTLLILPVNLCGIGVP